MKGKVKKNLYLNNINFPLPDDYQTLLKSFWD